MSQTDEWTIGRLLTWTTDYFREHGCESPRLDAEVLLAEARNCGRIELYTAFDESADHFVRTAFRELVRRRSEGTPVAYLVGHREFYSLSFRVTPDVLIPRPETEYLVMTVLDLVKEHHAGEPVDLVDVGTGSGCIAIAAAHHLPTARLTAIDISPAALEVARANIEDHRFTDRIHAVEGDLLDGFPPEPQFDFVLSNPPYVSEAEFGELSRDVAEHEPRVALVGGATGAEVIARLIPAAAERLRPGGWLLVEISPMIEQRVLNAVAGDGRFETAETINDQAGLSRIIKVRRQA